MVLECLDIPVDLNHVYDHASQGRMVDRGWRPNLISSGPLPTFCPRKSVDPVMP
ncbi:hypothetical protein QR685DRAFT_530382 [Neurospora intermedia]|uniref:Uncharacterized protein n=1 Tax=Neurospora intermedia TaxID=5142 RepID=A0ABR3D6A3_NEUIN